MDFPESFLYGMESLEAQAGALVCSSCSGTSLVEERRFACNDRKTASSTYQTLLLFHYFNGLIRGPKASGLFSPENPQQICRIRLCMTVSWQRLSFAQGYAFALEIRKGCWCIPARGMPFCCGSMDWFKHSLYSSPAQARPNPVRTSPNTAHHMPDRSPALGTSIREKMSCPLLESELYA